MSYQFLIAIMTYLPFLPLHSYKIISCVFDYFLAGMTAWTVYKFLRGGGIKKRKPL